MENTNNVENTVLDNLDNNSTEEKTLKDNSTEKTFTQEEVDKIISKRLAREKKDLEEKIEKERKEAEELAKLSESEKQKKIFEKQLAEFEETKRAFEKEKLLNETQKQLNERNLPIIMAKYLVGENAEITLENINEFEQEFNSELERKVNERLKGNTLRTGTTKSNSSKVTKEEFSKMNYTERRKLYEQDIELYNELMKK